MWFGKALPKIEKISSLWTSDIFMSTVWWVRYVSVSVFSVSVDCGATECKQEHFKSNGKKKKQEIEKTGEWQSNIQLIVHTKGFNAANENVEKLTENWNDITIEWRWIYGEMK